jgi:hypothetical protein
LYNRLLIKKSGIKEFFMAKLENVILQILSEKTGISFLEDTGLYTSKTTDNTSDAPSFAVVLSKLNSSLSKSSIDNIAESAGYTNHSAVSAGYTSANSINISALVQKIKDNKSADVDSVIRSYLLANYGGSVDAVIKNLAGVQSLSSQINRGMQEALFNQIVAKLSIQVRQSLYSANSNNSSISESTDEGDSSADESSLSDIPLNLSKDS